MTGVIRQYSGVPGKDLDGDNLYKRERPGVSARPTFLDVMGMS